MSDHQKHRKWVVAGLLLGIFVSALDNTIVATAMGSIVANLGGLEMFVWVTSAYMVTEMAGMPIFGKLSDMYGRKRFFLFGLVLFLIGSILCGTAQNIVQLCIYRAIQGIGGGALMPIAFTIVFDIFPPGTRGKMSGLFGAVFGLSSIFGPLLGAYITDYMNWRWVFFMNIPIGAVAFLAVALGYKETMQFSKQKIDWWGLITLAGSIVCLMVGLEMGGRTFAWDSGVIAALLAGFVGLFAAFLFVEKRAAEPIVSFQMFSTRLFASSTMVALLYGASFIVATVYIPIFVQGVMGGSASSSGMLLLPMMLGSVAASQIGGFAATRVSYRTVMLASTCLFIIGIVLLGTITPETSRFTLTLYMIMTGLGTGASFSVLGMAAIHHFDIRQRGAANSSLAFLRSLGMTLGITVFGIVQRNLFSGKLASTGQLMGAGMEDHQRMMLTPETRATIPEGLLHDMVAALSSSVAQTFQWAIVPALLAGICLLWMSKERLLIEKRVEKVPN